jgi:hypothetical protein
MLEGSCGENGLRKTGKVDKNTTRILAGKTAKKMARVLSIGNIEETQI